MVTRGYFLRVVGEAPALYSGRYTLSFGNKNPGTWFLNPLNSKHLFLPGMAGRGGLGKQGERLVEQPFIILIFELHECISFFKTCTH